MQHDPSADLMGCLTRKHAHFTNESRSLHALEIIRSGGYIHSVTEDNETCLHLAIKFRLLDVVQLLLEKGIDANAQNKNGETALHKCCDHPGNMEYQINVQLQTELVSMLLYYGADPWIRNNRNETPLDWIINYRFDVMLGQNDLEKWNLIASIEHLYYYMFDKYTEFGISVDALLKAADLNLPIFQEMIETIKEVDVDNLATNKFVDIEHLFTMPSENLRLILHKFDYVFIALFLTSNLCAHDEFCLENVYVIGESHLWREFIGWLCKWQPSYRFIDCLFRNPAPLASRQEIVYYLLSCGMEMDAEDVETVYKYCGYNELFKFLRFVDVKTRPSYSMTELIPRLVFQVNGDIQRKIEDPRFWVEHITNKYSKLDFEPVLPYYAILNLKDRCCEVKVKRRKKLCKQLLDQPQIPLLVEMARNVFRKYFIQRLGIRNAKQFYESLDLLPISPHHRKIITLETALY